MTLRNSRELRILVFLQNLKWPGTSSQVCASGVGALHKEIVSQTQSHLPSRRGRQNTGSRERLQRRKPFRSRSQCSALARRARGLKRNMSKTLLCCLSCLPPFRREREGTGTQPFTNERLESRKSPSQYFPASSPRSSPSWIDHLPPPTSHRRAAAFLRR